MTPVRKNHRTLGYAAALAVVTAGLIAAPPQSARAQAQVPKTVRILVPFPAGGPTDTAARVISEQIGKLHGISFVIENRVGGGSAIASEAAARATPDGGTLLVVAGALLINPILKKLNYDPLTSFEPICKLVRVPHFIVVNKDSPLKSFADFIAAARARPGELTFATVGPATGPHIAFETLKRRANVDVRFVPYPGTTPSINAVLGGHVAVAMGDFRDVIGALQGGLLRGLATTAPARTRAASRYSDRSRTGISGLRGRKLFRAGGAGGDTQRDHEPAHHLGVCGTAGRGRALEARQCRAVSDRHLRRGIRRASAPAARALCAGHPRGEHPGAIVAASVNAGRNGTPANAALSGSRRNDLLFHHGQWRRPRRGVHEPDQVPGPIEVQATREHNGCAGNRLADDRRSNDFVVQHEG